MTFRDHTSSDKITYLGASAGGRRPVGWAAARGGSGKKYRGVVLLLDKGLHKPLVLFAALLDEAGGRRYLELPHLERAFFLYTDDDKAGRA